MRLKSSTVVGDLLEAHPNAAEVFEWYGVELEDAHHEWTLGEVCDEFNVDPMDLVVDLELAVEEGGDADDVDDADDDEEDDRDEENEDLDDGWEDDEEGWSEDGDDDDDDDEDDDDGASDETEDMN